MLHSISMMVFASSEPNTQNHQGSAGDMALGSIGYKIARRYDWPVRGRQTPIIKLVQITTSVLRPALHQNWYDITTMILQICIWCPFAKGPWALRLFVATSARKIVG